MKIRKTVCLKNVPRLKILDEAFTPLLTPETLQEKDKDILNHSIKASTGNLHGVRNEQLGFFEFSFGVINTKVLNFAYNSDLVGDFSFLNSKEELEETAKLLNHLVLKRKHAPDLSYEDKEKLLPSFPSLKSIVRQMDQFYQSAKTRRLIHTLYEKRTPRSYSVKHAEKIYYSVQKSTFSRLD